MKKVLAIVLTIVMMFAVCVPAFAADLTINETAPAANAEGKQTVDHLVKTSTQKEDGSNGATYLVTIPAETTIPWEKENYEVSYDIVSQLQAGKRLEIAVASQSGVNELVDAAGNKLPYELKTVDGAALATVKTATEVLNTTEKFNINIALAKWQAAPVNEYTGYLTFAVEVVDA